MPRTTTLFTLIRPYSIPLLTASTLLLYTTSITMKIPQFVKQIIDQKTEALRKNGIQEKQDRNTQLETITKAMTKENNSNSLQPTLPLLSAVFVTMFIAAAARIYIIRTTADRITAGLRARLYKTILNRELKFFEKNTGGEISSRLNTDVQILANAVTGNTAI